MGWLGGFSAGLPALTHAAAVLWKVNWTERPKLISPHVCQLVLVVSCEPWVSSESQPGEGWLETFNPRCRLSRAEWTVEIYKLITMQLLLSPSSSNCECFCPSCIPCHATECSGQLPTTKNFHVYSGQLSTVITPSPSLCYFCHAFYFYICFTAHCIFLLIVL